MVRVNSLPCKTFVLAFLWFLLVCIVPAMATHQVEHRFIIHGRVFDDQGVPLSRALVVVRDKTGRVLGTTKTSSNGSYRILLHLHNDTLGKELTVSANKRDNKLKVTFDSFDFKTERMAEVNFGTLQGVDKGSNRLVILGAVSFVVLVIGAYIIHSGRKKRRQKITRGKKGQAKKKRR